VRFIMNMWRRRGVEMFSWGGARRLYKVLGRIGSLHYGV
jgi:hypothetical protein